MSNTLKFELKKEVKLDKNLKEIGEPDISLYACCDEISSWVGYANTFAEAKKMIKPENIEELFAQSLSEVELAVFEAILSYNKKYKFYDLEFKYNGNV